MHGPTTPRRVLVVEDGPDAADTLRFLLTHWGHAVRVAPDGPAALALAPAFRPDVVLLDLGLPRLDGFEVARRLLALRAIEPPVLVAATGHDGPGVRRRAREAGIRHFLRKPYDPNQLRAILADPAAVPHDLPGAPDPAAPSG